jgi:hypothetical protein
MMGGVGYSNGTDPTITSQADRVRRRYRASPLLEVLPLRRTHFIVISVPRVKQPALRHLVLVGDHVQRDHSQRLTVYHESLDV